MGPNCCLVVTFWLILPVAIGFIIQSHELYNDNEGTKVIRDVVNSTGENLSCGQCGLENRHRIVGGRDALTTEFPWLAVIKYWHLKYCSGSLINDRYVLTAAHCVERKFIQLFSVVMYQQNIVESPSEVTFKVAKVVLNPFFDPDTFDYDIALLRLSQKVNFGIFLRPVCLPVGSKHFTGYNATVVGWGAILEHNKEEFSDDNLNKLEIPVVSNNECKESTGLKPYLISNRMLCAGDLKGGKDACQGDSGGPLLIKEVGRWIQIGIVSWGVGCARPEHYGVYTRLSEFLSWINENLNESWSC